MKIRYSKLEEQVKKIITSNINVQHSYENNNSIEIVEIRKRLNECTKLFQDVDSPYLTLNKNPQITEFVLHAPKHKINWRIECAYQKEYSKNVGKVIYELNHVKNLFEKKLILVLDGVLDNDKFKSDLKYYVKKLGLKKRVWFGNVREFEELLIKKTN